MAPRTRRWQWSALILAAAVLGAGCNPLTAMFFLFPGKDPGIPPKCKLASDDKEKEVKVLVLTYAPLETRPEFLRVDYEISHLLTQKLQAAHKEKKQKVTIIPTHKVEKYKDEHPNWRAQGPIDIGQHFKADYVIVLEVDAISLYPSNSHNLFLQGRAQISVDAIDLNNLDHGPVLREVYTIEHPRARGPVPTSDTNLQMFRLAFLNRIATEISWYFVPHTYKEQCMLE
ncbi:MAG: hypothetical protein ACK4RK_20130 [Gemmataceae bacterium]